MRTRLVLVATGVALLIAPLLATAVPAGAATIVAEYAVGHPDVLLNGYRAPALGTFTLRDGDRELLALCVEAADAHSMATEAYQRVDRRHDLAELDALLWWLERQPILDHDTATAAAALAWYYAGAMRDIGVLVWADGTRRFAAITPLEPEPWSALPRYSLAHPIGLRSGSTELDAAEQRVEHLHRLATQLAGPWQLTVSADRLQVALTGRAGPIAGQPVRFRVAQPEQPERVVDAVTDANGMAALPDVIGSLDAVVTAEADAPGLHEEFDGAGAVQRMVTPVATVVTATLTIPAVTTSTLPPTTTTTTLPPATTSTTTTPSTTSTTTSTTTTSTTTTSTTTTTTTTTTMTSTTTTTLAPVTTTSTTTSTTTTPPPPLSSTLPPPPVPQAAPPPTLPATGNDLTARLLDLADLTFIVGVLLIVAGGISPRKQRTENSERRGPEAPPLAR